MADPAAVEGTIEQRRRAFRDAFLVLKRRIELFASLPLAKLDALSIKREMDRIGKSSDPAAQPAGQAEAGARAGAGLGYGAVCADTVARRSPLPGHAGLTRHVSPFARDPAIVDNPALTLPEWWNR